MNTFMRYIPAALLLVALAGCSIDDSYPPVGTEEKQLTIKAIREDDEPETRTVRNEKGKVYWSKGDQISLFYGQGSNGGSVFTSNQEADTVKVTNFVGTITAITGGGEISADETYFWGLYPYNETASCDGNSITTTLSSRQEAYPGSYANGVNISVGRSQGLIMGFYNACGGFRFSLNKEGVKKVTFTGNNDENLAGKLKISFVNGKVSTQILEGEKEVVLEAPAGKYFEPGVLYYIVLAPAVLSNGFSVKAETFTEETTFTYGSSITIEASNFKSKKLMDSGLTWTKKTGNIPIEDANFKAYLVENFDDNGDGEISYEEAERISRVEVLTDNIESMGGIEYLVNLNNLTCSGPGSGYETTGLLTNLDVSNNKDLRSLSCEKNRITSIDLSNNTELKTLRCLSNPLGSIDLSNNAELTYLNCESCQLVDIDLSNNALLKTASLGHNKLSALDISNNTSMENIWCNDNELSRLDLSNNISLTVIGCSSNHLDELDVSANTALIDLSCDSNQLTALDVSNNPSLTILNCGNNLLTSLDVSNNKLLSHFHCHRNQISNIDISNNKELTQLYCDYNQLTELDVSSNTLLKDFGCESNQLTYLDVSSNPELWRLSFKNNNLSSIDLAHNPKLEWIDCSGTGITVLDLSKCDESIFRIYRDSVLETVIIRKGQTLPYDIPESMIVVVPDDGGTGDNTDDEL